MWIPPNKFFRIALGIWMIGCMANLLAITSNDGRMPVYNYHVPSNAERHFSFYNFSDVNFPYLTDVIPNIPGVGISSIGDWLIVIGILSMFAFNCVQFYKWRKERYIN